MEGESSKPIPEDVFKNTLDKLTETSIDQNNIYGGEFLGFLAKERKVQGISQKPKAEAQKQLITENASTEVYQKELLHNKKEGEGENIDHLQSIPKNFGIGEVQKSKHYEQLMQYGAHQTIQAENYQKDVLADIQEDPSIPDYPAAYKKLVGERNKPWKLNPSDIADFYLLEGYIGEHDGEKKYHEDPEYVAVAKAKGRVTDIGRRLLVSLAHEQLDEYDRFARITPDSIPENLGVTIHRHYQETRGEETAEDSHRFEDEINAYLTDFNIMIEDHAERGATMDIFSNEDTNAMFGHALGILESQQTGRWNIMARAMRALHDNFIPMGDFVRSITATDGNVISPEMEAQLERQREPFLIDRLLNYVHNTGTMSARVTNYFPRAAALLLAHGMPGHNDYLLFHSRVGYGNDTLGQGIYEYATRVGGSDLIGDLATAIQSQEMPREYKYAMMMEFGDERLHNAVQSSTIETITPTRAYTLLQRVSHHDGHSRGRIK